MGLCREIPHGLIARTASRQVLRRVWCLFEIWKTVHYKGVENLVVVAHDVDILGLKVRVSHGRNLIGVWTEVARTKDPYSCRYPRLCLTQDIFQQLSVVEAQATVESDRHRILHDIRSSMGIEPLNSFIRKALVESTRHQVKKLEPVKSQKPTSYFQAVDKAGQMMTLAGMYSEAEPMMQKCLDHCISLSAGENSMQVGARATAPH